MSNQTNISIRPLQPEHAEAVRNFHARAVLQSFKGIYPDEVLEKWAASRSGEGYLRHQANGENFLVAFISEKPVGFIGWKDGELCGLYVDPDYQRHAIGTLLVQSADAEANLKQRPITFVNAGANARGFYEKIGFRFVREGTFTVCGYSLPDFHMER